MKTYKEKSRKGVTELRGREEARHDEGITFKKGSLEMQIRKDEKLRQRGKKRERENGGNERRKG